MLLGLEATYAQSNTGVYERKYKRAMSLYQKGAIKRADEVFKSIIADNPKYAEIYSKIGRHYFDNNRFLDAAYYFEMGSKSVPGAKQAFALPLARAYYRASAPEKAGVALSVFSSGSQSNKAINEEVMQLQKAIEFSRLVSYNTHNVKVENLRWPVNSELDDYAPSFSVLNSDLVFTRKINDADENFFISHLDTCALWSDALDIGFPLNSSKPESYQNRAFNDKYMIYQQCDNRSPNGWTQGGCDLFLSYSIKEGWSEPRPFGYTINTTAFEGMPSLNASETALYFVSDRPGGYGGKDIWVSYFENGKWQVPQNLGPNINTSKDEIAPSIAADGKTFFFSSNGKPGFGGFDIYTSKLQNDSTWSNAVNLGVPMNSNYDDISGSVTLDGKYLFFASDRVGGFGGIDIYKGEIPVPFAPKPMTLVYGIIEDFETHSKISSTDISLLTPSLNAPDIITKGNRGDGSFYAMLPKGIPYTIKIENSFYQTLTDSFVVSSGKDVDTLQYLLLPEGVEPNKKRTELLSFNWKEYNSTWEDSLCLMINDKLQGFSGKILNLSIESYYNSSDNRLLDTFNRAVQMCFYKMGISDEYVKFINHAIPNDEPNQHTNPLKMAGIAIFKLDYLDRE